MNLQRSLLTSVLIHALIFGSAVAFARFGTGELWSRENTVEVMIVSRGSDKGGGGAAESFLKREEPLSVPPKHDIPHGMNEAAPREVMPDPGAKPELAAAAAPAISGAGNSAQGAGREETGRDHGGEPGFGLISREQWSDIEAAIERNKTYPRLARERAIQGTVRLRFKVARTGAVEKLEVIESSGSEILDSASVRSVYRAAPMPYVSGWVEIPIAYVLK
jgi:TonB family protein